MTINAFPLQWPAGWKRSGGSKSANFKRYGKELSIYDGVERVLGELERMGYTRNDVVISTNVETRLDGLPRSDRAAPGDPGVAAYWRTHKGDNKVMAVDRYDRVADNLAAIAATLEAMRSIERHGGAMILERAFTGFTALPAPGGSASSRPWREILGVATDTVTADMLKARYRLASSAAHPDKGGTDAAMSAVNLAYEQAKLELGYP